MNTEPFPEQDLELARRIHRTLLPRRHVTEQIDIDVRYHETNLLGGDYATVYEHAPNRFLICVCDVTGHGLAAALLAGRVNSFVRYTLRQVDHPCEVVDKLNGFIWRNFEGLGLFPTFFCLEIDLPRRRLQYVGCGHPPALHWVARNRRCLRLPSRHVPIGVFPVFPGGCEISRVTIEPGDRLLVYTDGVIETRDESCREFGIERVESILEAEGSPRLLDTVFSALSEFRHGTQTDDVLVVAARIL